MLNIGHTSELLTTQEFTRLRRVKYRQTEETHVRTESDALDFINDLGFVWLINLSEADLPSLHYAAPTAYLRKSGDSEARTWWDSKQTLSGAKECYYAKVLRGRGTFISWECFPLFYAVYGNGRDYLDDYHDGLLSREEKRVLDLVSANPGISSRDLRRKFGSAGKDITRTLDRALQRLQETFRLTIAGGSLEGWTLHNWALVEDWVDGEYLRQAVSMDVRHAKKELIVRYLQMAVAAAIGDIAWVFRWRPKEVTTLVNEVEAEGQVHPVEIIGLPGVLYTANIPPNTVLFPHA